MWFGLQGREVGVSRFGTLGLVSEIDAVVGRVKRRVRDDAFDKVRIGEHVRAIGFKVGKARCDVLADIRAGTRWAVEDDRSMPDPAEVVQDVIFAIMDDVNIGEAKLVQFADKVTEQIRPLGTMAETHTREPGR
ncbi:hypothetical protein AWB73_05343 [Caballeronia turbans]|nr:hypothetical protein AWB73_05343 [Caballeronia turbans]